MPKGQPVPIVLAPPDNWASRSVKECSTCIFYLNFRCRRHAPTLAGYPAVYPTDFCGDHKMSKAIMAVL